ncbi:DUF47 family protein [Egibacter rhizosphaerae]|uniref:DUF47 family protein n=1 Tax=Egibacter rhizosphaerae TaxID=1670831 RepID=A0A411YGI6_9ACTN|nr:DUF47 family protein [Egibacter rhizosphaerae]QBI20192.1 DUF47 family protein [Egibacter rhizosphaerae]
MRWLRTLLRDLTGRRDGEFVGMLQGQVDCGISAAAWLRDAAAGDTGLDEALAEVRRVEAEADRTRDTLVAELNRSLTTPLDREDLMRLSRALDNVVDNLRDLADTLDAFRVSDPSGCVRPLDELWAGLNALHAVIGQLDGGSIAGLAAAARDAKRVSRVRVAFVEGLRELFTEPVTGDVLARRELLRRLDVVGLRLGEACDALADAALKRA